jgi:hypothetical protein
MPGVDLSGFFGTVLLLWIGVTLCVFGVPAAWLANEKGRNPAVWAIVGILIGPMAVLAVGFSPRVAEGEFGACPSCLEVVYRDAEMCPFCKTQYPKASE